MQWAATQCSLQPASLGHQGPSIPLPHHCYSRHQLQVNQLQHSPLLIPLRPLQYLFDIMELSGLPDLQLQQNLVLFPLLLLFLLPIVAQNHSPLVIAIEAGDLLNEAPLYFIIAAGAVK